MKQPVILTNTNIVTAQAGNVFCDNTIDLSGLGVPYHALKIRVKKIYDLAIHGAGPFKITQTLTAEKVPTASWINFQRNGGFACSCNS